jgi:hypothetical protein
MSHAIKIEPTSLSVLQKIRLELFQITPTAKKTRSGWKGELQFYAFKCPEHGLMEDYPHGYRQTLVPSLQVKRIILIDNLYFRAKTVKYSRCEEHAEA